MLPLEYGNSVQAGPRGGKGRIERYEFSSLTSPTTHNPAVIRVMSVISTLVIVFRGCGVSCGAVSAAHALQPNGESRFDDQRCKSDLRGALREGGGDTFQPQARSRGERQCLRIAKGRSVREHRAGASIRETQS